MASLATTAWLLIGGVAIGGLLAVLYTVAETVRCERHVHDAKVRAGRLRLQYAAQLAVQPEGAGEIIIVDEVPAEELRQAA